MCVMYYITENIHVSLVAGDILYWRENMIYCIRENKCITCWWIKIGSMSIYVDILEIFQYKSIAREVGGEGGGVCLWGGGGGR
jgi:hypothetical protein